MKPMPLNDAMFVQQRIIDGVRESWQHDPCRNCLAVRWDALKNGKQVTASLDRELLQIKCIDDPRLAGARKNAIATL